MVITVTCPSCSASFPVDSNKVPAAGVNARCSSCRHVFRIERPAEPTLAGLTPPPPPAPHPRISEPTPWLERPSEPEPPAPRIEERPREAPTAEAAFSAGPEVPPLATESRDWVIEPEERVHPGTLVSQPIAPPEPVPLAPSFEVEPPPPPPPPPPLAPEPAPTAVGSFTFGKRDPKDKARRLARVLVSDMIMYNPERHARALANGTLRQDFADEIAKSWKEYVEQVGEEMATQNTFWTDALNDVLARGQKIF